MRIGRMRHRITIQQVTETRTTTGAVSEAWSPFAVMWANIEPIQGREYFAAKQTMSEVTHRIRIRYLAGITTKMRVLYDNRVFDVHQVIDYNEGGREMHIMATESL